MASTQLTLITGPKETPAQTAQRLMAEAAAAAEQQVRLLEDALERVHVFAREVSDGGSVYPVGVRDLSRKLSDDAAWCAQTIAAIMLATGARRAGGDRP